MERDRDRERQTERERQTQTDRIKADYICYTFLLSPFIMIIKF